jgi:hypothetical protein
MVERLDWGREGAALATATFVAFCVVPGGLLAVAVVVAVVVAGFGAGAGIVAGAGGGEARLIALLFWLVMPYINGLLDWISLSVSRWFGRAILAERDSPRSLAITVGLALADLLAAVAFAFTVAWLLAFGVEASALVLDLSLDLEQYVKAAAEAPWTAGFWASFMVLSTLLPSAFHLMLALGAVLVAWSGNPLRAWAVQKLKSADEADWLWPQLYLTFGWCVPAIVAPLGLLWLVAQGVGLIEPLPAALRDTAFHGIATAQAWLL